MMLTVMVSICLTMLVMLPVFVMVYRQLPPQLATVDLQKIIEEDQSRIVNLLGSSAGNLSEQGRLQNEQMATDFARRLTSNIEQIGAECHCILINKAALLSGNAVDYTDLLMERMKK